MPTCAANFEYVRSRLSDRWTAPPPLDVGSDFVELRKPLSVLNGERAVAIAGDGGAKDVRNKFACGAFVEAVGRKRKEFLKKRLNDKGIVVDEAVEQQRGLLVGDEEWIEPERVSGGEAAAVVKVRPTNRDHLTSGCRGQCWRGGPEPSVQRVVFG